MKSKLSVSEDLPELRARFAAHDFLVDFLGGLVPGMLFLLGFAVTFIPTLHIIFIEFIESPARPLGGALVELLVNTRETPNTLWVIGFFMIITISYVVGHLFYRRDPKKPDQHSFRKLARAGEGVDLRVDAACTSEVECEFPYPYLDAYLEKRGHVHLLPLVSWRVERGYRSKTYVNMLKIRLRYFHPEKCSSIIWNEAHVRLASSTWYVTRALRYCFLIAVCVLGLVLLQSWLAAPQDLQAGRFAGAFLWPVVVLVLAEFGRDRIEKFLHYQRLREVFYVLETAYTAFREHPEDLDPPFHEFAEAVQARARKRTVQSQPEQA